MDSQFTQVTSRGEVTDLDQNVAEVSKRDPYYDEFRNHDQTVRLYGDAAIVIGITTTKGKPAANLSTWISSIPTRTSIATATGCSPPAMRAG